MLASLNARNNLAFKGTVVSGGSSSGGATDIDLPRFRRKVEVETTFTAATRTDSLDGNTVYDHGLSVSSLSCTLGLFYIILTPKFSQRRERGATAMFKEQDIGRRTLCYIRGKGLIMHHLNLFISMYQHSYL